MKISSRGSFLIDACNGCLGDESMSERPKLNNRLDSSTFRSYYYLKEELIQFCRQYNLPVSGGKLELTERIAYFLDTGKVKYTSEKRRTTNVISEITEETIIESDIVCSEIHRFFSWIKSAKAFLLM